MATSQNPEGSAPTSSDSPVSIVCVGMAGSGKTTFMQRLVSHLYTHPDPTVATPAVSQASTTPPYILNLDPAVRHVPFTPNIDIRDSVNYKEVMKQFNLGPNGGILTSLNLFSTKIDQVIGLLEKRTAPPTPAPVPEQSTVEFMTGQGKAPAPATQQQQVKHILVDTPGQIEVFVWSASGEILLSSLASTFPTVIAYIIDTPRTTSTSTFMSNMLYACSILYKTKLPMILVFNKTDAQSADFAKEWMTDFESFQEALRKEEEGGAFGGEGMGGGSGYMGSLLNSMSLVLEEFYNHLSVVGVSAMTGDGMDEFFKGVQTKKEEFERDYKPELERRRAEREKEKVATRQRELDRLMKDMKVGGPGGSQKRPPKEQPETVSDAEDMEEGDGVPMVGDDSDEEVEDADDSLESRYQNALNESRGGEQGPSGDDFSFARYMHKSNIG
ncbi:XPA-binding protein-like protein [Aaosphaeria arxii CBS 175.79]|uniref:GPN-loop GTPase n=1 Tax=Aaosphaeria arxii CBS 175.79 TaxID=1450172 RepID=A0A6A5XZT6_9PLEO|nr:XPA-binding protein-like protein [Aaosphaeria arxii CBS 175.79]KAF2018785.1 XPA-binding protein-like protein [Aaosphaeria arxii CBS 175.79]